MVLKIYVQYYWYFRRMDPILCSCSRPINTTILCPDLTKESLKAVIKSRTRIRSSEADNKKDIKILTEELKLLNTVLFKNHNRFRNDKGYKTLRMVEKSLQKFLISPIHTTLPDLLQFVPDTLQTSVHLPTLAMCQYCMLQCYQSAALLSKLEILCRRSGLLNMQRLNLGHFWGVAAANLAIVGRVWVIVRNLLSRHQIIFSHLFKISIHLPGTSAEYLLPADLFEFLPQDLKEILIEADRDAEREIDTGAKVTTVNDFLDLGEPVKRKLVDENQEEERVKQPKLLNESNNSTRSKEKDALGQIHSLNDMHDFLKRETEIRKVDKKTSFTRKLNKEQWKAVKKEVLDNMNPERPNKSIKLCRKIIRMALN